MAEASDTQEIWKRNCLAKSDYCAWAARLFPDDLGRQRARPRYRRDRVMQALFISSFFSMMMASRPSRFGGVRIGSAQARNSRRTVTLMNSADGIGRAKVEHEL